jgi:hypothetical protein
VPIKNVLIVCSNGGNGLVAYSNHLAKFLKAGSPHLQVSIVNPFLEAHGLGDLLFNRIYNYLVATNLVLCSALVNLSYLTRPDKNLLVTYEAGEVLSRHLKSYPDVVVCVSPWAVESVRKSLQEAIFQPRLVVCVPDLGEGMPPGFFSHAGVDKYFVHTTQARETLVAHSVPKGKVVLARFPILAARAPNGRPKVKKVLVMAGVNSQALVLDLIQALPKGMKPIELTVACGKSGWLRKKIIQESAKPGFALHDVRVLGDVGDVFHYIQYADIVVTKPGALTVVESFLSGKPSVLLAYPKVMPQERGNVVFVSENGIGFVAKSAKGAWDVVLSLVEKPEMVEKTRKNIAVLEKKNLYYQNVSL